MNNEYLSKEGLEKLKKSWNFKDRQKKRDSGPFKTRQKPRRFVGKRRIQRSAGSHESYGRQD